MLSSPYDPAADWSSPESASVHRNGMQALGLSVEEECVYRALLRHPGVTTFELSRKVELQQGSLEELLAQLHRRGVVRSTSGPARVWEATSPEVAIELLLMERQLELMEARKMVPDLRNELTRRAVRPVTGELLVLPPEPSAQMGAFSSLLEQARSRLDFIVKPPFLAALPDSICIAREAARTRGVRIRTIISTEVVRWKGWEAAVANFMSEGEECRLLDDPPFKLAMADRQATLMPLRGDDGDGPALRLGDVAIMKALDCLFEALWRQAVPIETKLMLSRSVACERDSSTEELVTALASGANDKVIADILGISARTLQRRLGLLYEQLGAKSRFQAGWLAALHQT